MGEARFAQFQSDDVGELLARLPSVTMTTRGVSMRPLIVSRRDWVTVSRAGGELRPGDVALYRRRTQGKTQYVLHRVIGVEETRYRILGDNYPDVELVPKEDVLGVMTHLIRKGRAVDLNGPAYRRYVRLWRALYPLRRIRLRLRARAGRLLRMVCPRAARPERPDE